MWRGCRGKKEDIIENEYPLKQKQANILKSNKSMSHFLIKGFKPSKY